MDIGEKITSPDGLVQAEFSCDSAQRQFRYTLLVWVDVDEDEFRWYPDGGYWSHREFSGIYESLKSCEEAAREAITNFQIN